MLATIALATALVAADATAALSSAVAEDVPVPSGLAALARALEIEPLAGPQLRWRVHFALTARTKAQPFVRHFHVDTHTLVLSAGTLGSILFEGPTHGAPHVLQDGEATQKRDSFFLVPHNMWPS